MKKLKEGIKNEEGAVLVIVALGMFVLMGFTALVVDVGAIYKTRSDLINAADAAALAGAQKLLPEDPNNIDAAESFAEDFIDINVGEYKGKDATAPGDNTIEVTVDKNVDFYFASALGFENITVSAYAKAEIGGAKKVYGDIVPFGIEEDIYKGLKEGDEIILMLREPEGGNCYALALGGKGANVLASNILNGYGPLSIGAEIDTEPGVNLNKVREAAQQRINEDRRFVVAPIVTEIEDGRDTVTVLGFVAIYFEDVPDKKDKEEGIVRGTIQSLVVPGEPGESVTETNV